MNFQSQRELERVREKVRERVRERERMSGRELEKERERQRELDDAIVFKMSAKSDKASFNSVAFWLREI